MKAFRRTCDIFCTVVDNYGDIGVSWRLARQLAGEPGVAVRLWVDDLVSFARLCPQVDPARKVQWLQGVEVRRWMANFPPVEAADWVIEAFACRLPPRYVAAMAARARKPVWVNLEYLSAEEWVEGCHKLPSPHPTLPLTRYFFFPGFMPRTGGLLRERDLFARRDAFQADAAAQLAFWQSLDMPPRQPEELRVSLFCYENEALAELFQAWEQGPQPITCCVPEGRVLPQVERYFGATGRFFARGQLRVQVLPFLEQDRYDTLLWACDINFVRGEDSCVRAQWAARPFVWHIYPQHDGVHRTKLAALCTRYVAGLEPGAAQAVRKLWEGWNGDADLLTAWPDYLAQRDRLTRHGRHWAKQLSANNLALNLLDFLRQNA